MSCQNQFEYRRFAAVLYEKDGHYSFSPTRRPRGYARVEIKGSKGRLVTQVRNLRPLGGNNSAGTRTCYRLRLIGERDGKAVPVNVGAFDVSSRGSGEIRWELNPFDVGGSGLGIDDVTGVEVIVHDEDARYQLYRYPVLCGFIELTEALTPEYPNLEKIKPFGEMPGHAWWKSYLPLDANGRLSCPKLVSDAALGYVTRPVFQGHQLIGLQYDNEGGVKYLVHGVPGMYCPEDQPFQGKTGYVFWQPLPGQSFQAGSYGYWLIHIDVATGEVVLPDNPTPPPSCAACLRERDRY